MVIAQKGMMWLFLTLFDMPWIYSLGAVSVNILYMLKIYLHTRFREESHGARNDGINMELHNLTISMEKAQNGSYSLLG